MCSTAARSTATRRPRNSEPLVLSIEDRFLANTAFQGLSGGSAYRRSTDTIQMPDEGLFIDTDTLTRTEGHYATLHTSMCTERRGAPPQPRIRQTLRDQAYAAEDGR
jgi:antirestriction protein ArdC